MNELLDRVLPAKLWALTGQLQFISACTFILFAVNTSIEVNLLFVGWAISGTGIFAGVFCTNKVLSTE